MQNTFDISGLLKEKIDQLFIDRTTKVLNFFAQTNLIIINPSAIRDLFVLAKTSTPEENFDLLGLIKFLNKILLKQPINSLTVYQEGELHYSGYSKKSLPHYLVEFYFELREKKAAKEILDELKKLVILLIQNNYLEKSVIRVIYQQSVKEYYQGFISKDTLEDALNLLHEIFSVNEIPPQSFFYFNYQNSKMEYLANNKRSLKWPFLNGLSLCLWFYMESLDTYDSNFPSLFLIHCFQKGGGGVEAYFKGRKLFYRLLTINYDKASNNSEGIEIGEFYPKNWYFLGIEHEKSSVFGSSTNLTIYINNDAPKKSTYEYLKMEQGRTITSLSFGRGFVGKMTSIILFPSPIKKKLSELYSKFPLGIYNNSLIEALKKILENNKIKPFIIYLPNRIIHENEVSAALDLVDQYNAKFSQNTGARLREQSRLKMSYFGGVSGLLPYFSFLRYLSDQDSVNEIFIKLLRILMVLFTVNIENQKEAGECNLFKILGTLLAETPYKIISHETMETLAEMRHILKDERLINQFFLEIIWNIPLISRIDNLALSNYYFKFIRIIYVEDPLRYSTLLSIPNLLRLAVYKFDAKNMECCLSHCLNNGLIKPGNQILKEFKWEADKILVPLFSIVELIMTHDTTPEQIICEALKNIIETLIIKCSPCFQLYLLKLLKTLMIDGFCMHGTSDDFGKTIIESKLIYIMLYLVGNSLCPDIKAYCIKIINFLIKNQMIYYENYSTKEISNYLSLVLWNLSPKSNKQQPEKSNNSTREESKSEDFSSNFRTVKSRSISTDIKEEKIRISSADTKEMQEKTPVLMTESLSLKKKKMSNLQIDIEEINKENEIKESQSKEDIEYTEIVRMAHECVNYMRRKLSNDKTLIPQFLIKTDYFKEKSSIDETPNFDLEEISWDCEPLYNSIMEWLLGKQPANLESDLLIDDDDKILNPEVLSLVFDFFKKSPGNLKAKILQNFYMLVKWNKNNIQLCLEEKEFIAWLIDILLEQQSGMKEEDRTAYDVAIWDIGNKIMVILMRFTVESNFTDASDKLYYILQYLQLKSYYTNNKKNSDKEKELALAAKYLLRHIWTSFLESLSESVHSFKSVLSNTFWRNFAFVIYFTLETVCSIYSPKALSPGFRQKCVEAYPTLKKCLTEIKEDEKIPSNFQPLISEFKHLDYKLIDTLFKLLEPIWIESELNKPVSLLITAEVEKQETKISNLLDYKHSLEYSQKLEFLLFEPFQADQNINRTKGPLIKSISLLLTLMLDFEISSKNPERLTFWLEKLKLIFKSILIMGENARDKPFPLTRSQEKHVISNLIYLLHFLYLKEEIMKKNTGVHEIFVRTIKEIGLFMIFIIDHMNERFSGFANITKEFKSSLSASNPNLTPYNFLLYEIFNSIAFGPKNNKIISIPDIKNLKNEDLSDLHNVVFSDNWVYAFTDNQIISATISEYFNDNMYLKLSRAHESANENKDSRRKYGLLKEETNKRLKIKLDNEVYELILWILELNEEKKNKDWYSVEKKKRQAKFQWKKIWKKLRTFENLWQPIDFKAQRDCYFRGEEFLFEKLEPNKYFNFEMWKHETKENARPFLKLKLKEPKIKLGNEETEKNLDNPPNYQQIFNLIHQNFHLKEQFATESPLKFDRSQNFTGNLKNLGEKAFKTIKAIVANKQKSEIPLKSQSSEALFQRKCQWITSLTLKSGVFTLTPNKIIFHHDCLLPKETHLSILSFKLSPHTPFYKEWPLTQLKQVLPHRFILRKTSLNFLFKDGTSLLLNFPDTDPSIVLQRLLHFTKSDIFFSLNSRLLVLLKPPQPIEKTKIYKKWQNHEISNFAYLMYLNLLAGRSYSDITQYPVFPWIMSVYSMNSSPDLPIQVLPPEKIFRDLSKSMGALGDSERIRTFRERFEHTDAFDPVPNYHFGSHYSSPAIIMQYLIRMAPFNKGHKELQGGKFDLADRLFFSLQESYKGATEEISDVRELTPEFYYCPEILMNFEKHDFGVQQTGNRVNNVRLPTWSEKPADNANPYNFIKLHREFLEMEFVSENINNWIDLIFGYKQRGKEAEKALNTFFYLTYEDAIDLEKIEKETFKISYESQIIHFGQTPRQIFLKPHPLRLRYEELSGEGRIITDPKYQGKNYRYKLQERRTKNTNKPDDEIVMLKFISENRLAILKESLSVSFYDWSDNPVFVKEKNSNANIVTPFHLTLESEERAPLEQQEFPGNSPFLTNKIKAGFLAKGMVLVVGGYLDGCLKVFHLESEEEIKYYYHNEAITAMEIDEKERFLVTGSRSGECVYWHVGSNYSLTKKFAFYDHDNEILSLHISREMKVFMTGGGDQKIFIYNYMSGKLLRSLVHPDQQPINNLIIASSPLPVIVFFSEVDQMIYSYSVNGQLIEKVKEEANSLKNMKICKNNYCLDVLIYTTNRDEIVFRSLPYLEVKRRQKIQIGGILTMEISKDRKFILFGCGGGNITVCADPSYANKIFSMELQD